MTIPPLLSRKSFPSEGKSEIQLLQLMCAGFYFLSTSTRSLRPASKMAFSAQGQLQSPCESRGALAPGNRQGGCTPRSCHSAQHQQLWRGVATFPRAARSVCGAINSRDVQKPALGRRRKQGGKLRERLGDPSFQKHFTSVRLAKIPHRRPGPAFITFTRSHLTLGSFCSVSLSSILAHPSPLLEDRCLGWLPLSPGESGDALRNSQKRILTHRERIKMAKQRWQGPEEVQRQAKRCWRVPSAPGVACPLGIRLVSFSINFRPPPLWLPISRQLCPPPWLFWAVTFKYVYVSS